MSHISITPFPTKTQPVTDDYILTETVLGVGRRGKVLECHSRKTNQKFALKVLKDDKLARQQLNLHWKACFHLNGNHIVHIQDVYEDTFSGERCLLVIMECMEGGPLLTRIQERTQFTEREAAEIIHSIVSAIGHLHSMGIAHRNLKPKSVMFTNTTPAAVLKLGGFGFATKFEIGMSPASPCYTPALQSLESPEMLGRAKSERSCDLWSIGVIMYILLCGYPPFQSKAEAVISPWMKAMGHHSQYEFTDAEWGRVSSEAKYLIRHLLAPVPDWTIQQVKGYPWVAGCTTVPQTPLMTTQKLKKEENVSKDVEDEMTTALASMRVKDDLTPSIIVNRKLSESALHKKRQRQHEIVSTQGEKPR